MATTLYNSTPASGSSYQRAFSVYIDNPLNGTPSLSFVEEKVTLLDSGEAIHTQLGHLSTKFDAANADHVQLYTLLEALYTTLHIARDAAPPVDPLAPPVDPLAPPVI